MNEKKKKKKRTQEQKKVTPAELNEWHIMIQLGYTKSVLGGSGKDF